MTPYYQDDLVTIYHGDCREVIPELPLVPHVVVTDPPYGIGFEEKGRTRGGAYLGTNRGR